MEYNKINNLLLSEDNESEKLSKFVTREYVRVNSLLDTYNKNKSIRFKTPMLRSNLCNYSDAYILVKGKITVTALGANNGANNFDNIKVVNSDTFKYKSKIIGNTYDVDARITNPDGAGQIDNPIYNVNKNVAQEVELAIPSKNLGNFWRALNIP